MTIIPQGLCGVPVLGLEWPGMSDVLLSPYQTLQSQWTMGTLVTASLTTWGAHYPVTNPITALQTASFTRCSRVVIPFWGKKLILAVAVCDLLLPVNNT